MFLLLYSGAGAGVGQALVCGAQGGHSGDRQAAGVCPSIHGHAGDLVVLVTAKLGGCAGKSPVVQLLPQGAVRDLCLGGPVTGHPGSAQLAPQPSRKHLIGAIDAT